MPTPAHVVNLKVDETGAPAVNLSKHPGGVSLSKKFEAAGVSLGKKGLSGVRAQAVLYIDHSGSMEFDHQRYYSRGVVQELVERSLAYALQIDVDGSIPVIAFDSQLHPEVVVTLENYQGVVDREIWRKNRMGGTNYSIWLEDLIRRAKTTDAPILAIVVTDGDPTHDRKSSIMQLAAESSRYPVFIKFMTAAEVQFLEDLDDGVPGQMCDNIDTKEFSGARDHNTGKVIPRIDQISDAEFADAVTDEFTNWLNNCDAIA